MCSSTVKLYKDEEWLYQKYINEKLSSIKIAKLCGVCNQTVRDWLIKFDIPRRPGRFKSGRDNPNWGRRGAKFIIHQGYVYLPRVDGKPGYIAQHRDIAEKALGRPLKRKEMVHHINGDGLDNRNKNLLICDNKYHRQLHKRMSQLYMQEHFVNFQ